MRKQESVHLHALLLEVARYLDERAETEPVDLRGYAALRIGPSGVHRSKDAHEEAILVLATAIGEALRRTEEFGQESPVQ